MSNKKNESRTKYFGARVTPGFYEEVESIAAALSHVYGRPFNCADVFWALVDIALPEIMEETNSNNVSHSELLLSLAQRHFNRGQACLARIREIKTN